MASTTTKNEAKEKYCKHCKKKVNTAVSCEICEAAFHPSCALQAKVITKDERVICCQPHERNEIRKQKYDENLQKFDEEKLKKIVRSLFIEFVNPLKQNMEDKMKNIEESMQFLSGKFEEQKTITQDFITEIRNLKKEKDDMKQRIHILETQINSQEQKERQNNIIMAGIPKQRGDNTNNIIEKVMKTIKVTTDPGGIVDTYRMNKTEDAPIMVKLKNKDLRIQILKRIKELKGIRIGECGLVGENKNIYFNDDLTYSNQILLKRARELRKLNKITAAYSRNGKIYIKKTADDDPIWIRSIQDLSL